jgi:2,3,4,5-tetrahydropyridine-2,6-dicarboxylate N-succinyltransferase
LPASEVSEASESESERGPAAYGMGLATVHAAGSADERILDVAFVRFGLAPPSEELRELLPPAGYAHHDSLAVAGLTFGTVADPARRAVVRPTVAVLADLDAPPDSVPDAYLRLHLLSGRHVRPNELSLEGVFSVLPNVAWTDAGPCDPDDLERLRAARRAEGRHLVVHGLDKFPRMLDYVAPPGVRVADASRVRLGAHLAEGTTVMHEGFVNFNAGTLGPCMVEGRISQGVTVGAHSDVGGGASIMGTLSGGGKERVRVGEHCLLGANSGLGIALGDECTVEAGLYVTAGTLVRLPDERVVKARELSGASGLLFRRHSQSGAVEAVPRSAAWAGLNPALHAP